MSQWARENPELVGTDSDPWMQHKSYRDAMTFVKNPSGDYCKGCATFLQPHERGLCEECKS